MNEALVLALVDGFKALITAYESAKTQDPVTQAQTAASITSFSNALAANMAAGEAALAAKFPVKP